MYSYVVLKQNALQSGYTLRNVNANYKAGERPCQCSDCGDDCEMAPDAYIHTADPKVVIPICAHAFDSLDLPVDVVPFDRSLPVSVSATIFDFAEALCLAAALERRLNELGVIKDADFRVSYDENECGFTAVPADFKTTNAARAFTWLLNRAADQFFEEDAPAIFDAYSDAVTRSLTAGHQITRPASQACRLSPF